MLYILQNTCTRGRRASFLILLMMGAWRPKHVGWLCRNKTCTVLHQVGVLFDLYYDARKHKSKTGTILDLVPVLRYHTTVSSTRPKRADFVSIRIRRQMHKGSKIPQKLAHDLKCVGYTYLINIFPAFCLFLPRWPSCLFLKTEIHGCRANHSI